MLCNLYHNSILNYNKDSTINLPISIYITRVVVVFRVHNKKICTPIFSEYTEKEVYRKSD